MLAQNPLPPPLLHFSKLWLLPRLSIWQLHDHDYMGERDRNKSQNSHFFHILKNVVYIIVSQSYPYSY